MKSFSFGRGLSAAATLLILAGCSSEAPWGTDPTAGGKISLQLSTDASVLRSTRANDGQSPVVPSASQFGISLVSSDGSYSKEWASLDAFSKEEGFPMGVYTITASYGNLENDGFTNPYYKGEETVDVTPGKESSVSVKAVLANSMVSIRYTDKFAACFEQFSTSVQSGTNKEVVFAQTEDRPAYVAPGEVKLNVTMTNGSGKTVTVQPASFTASPRYHYVVTLDVEGDYEALNAVLEVSFDEDVVAETVEIPLTDELFNAPAPTVTAKGFNSGENVTTFEAMNPDVAPELNLFAFGGFKSVRLMVSTENGTKPLFSDVELVNASPDTQSKISEIDGLECYGLFKNQAQMAVLKFGKYLSKLKPGTYTIKVDVEDALGRHVTDNVDLNVTVEAVEYDFEVMQPAFLSDKLTVEVASNCPKIGDAISFQSLDANGTTVNVKHTATTRAVASTRAELTHHFTYVLDVAPVNNYKTIVACKYGSKSITKDVLVTMPVYTVETDAFAKSVKIRVSGEDQGLVKYIVENAKVYQGGSQFSVSHIDRTNVNDGIIVVSGLSASTTYGNLSLYLGRNAEEESKTMVPEFTTETAADVPNGDFSAFTKTIDFSDIHAGGQYRTSAAGQYYNTTKIIRETPDGWATINEKTCNGNSSNRCSWFMVPSTYYENGKVIIRSVAYDHAGEGPERSGNLANTTYYCTNAPSKFENRVAGELFLGSYSFTCASGHQDSEDRQDGIPFNSRPVSLSFDYSYKSYKNEVGVVIIKLLQSDGRELISVEKELPNADSKQEIINFGDYPFDSSVDKLVLNFKSTKGNIVETEVLSGSALNDNASKRDATIPDNSTKAVSIGSILTIDNVHLNY